jgi:hypothetical protein
MNLQESLAIDMNCFVGCSAKSPFSLCRPREFSFTDICHFGNRLRLEWDDEKYTCSRGAAHFFVTSFKRQPSSRSHEGCYAGEDNTDEKHNYVLQQRLPNRWAFSIKLHLEALKIPDGGRRLENKFCAIAVKSTLAFYRSSRTGFA